MQGRGPGRAGLSGADELWPPGSGLSRGFMAWRAASIMGWRALLRRGGGRASRDYYGMASPPATGGGQVGGKAYYGMAGARAAKGVLWDREDAPQGAGGGSGQLLWDGRARRSPGVGREYYGMAPFPARCDRATIMGWLLPCSGAASLGSIMGCSRKEEGALRDAVGSLQPQPGFLAVPAGTSPRCPRPAPAPPALLSRDQ